MKKRDAIIIAAILVIAAALFAARGFFTDSGDWTVTIRVDGKIHSSLPLSDNKIIMVELPGGGYNEVVIEAGSAFVRSASCPDKSCVRQGAVSPGNIADRYLGPSIICLPNRVVVELTRVEGGGQ